jgi:patatin-like phospholipase/acyl hydrolase
VIPFRRNVAIAVDGGGIKGIIVTKALAMLEKALGKPSHEIFTLAAGTSTGSIISAGIACGLTAEQMGKLYVELGSTIFKKTWRSFFFPLTKYRYSSQPLADALVKVIGTRTMGDLWNQIPQIDVVIPSFDLVNNHSCFIKPWKEEYASWPVTQAVMASSTVPTYFPLVAGRYVDGGVGAYANPCYLAAYEAIYYLGWKAEETTLISLGTGNAPHYLAPGQATSFFAWEWISPVLGAFLQSADDQQVQLTGNLFPGMDFRRFNVDLLENIEMDDPTKIPQLIKYGEILGRKILQDQMEPIPSVKALTPPRGLR